MNRATLVYIAMFVVSGVGLWAILGFGARLEAPADLSGRWVTEPKDDPPTLVGETIDIEQSGKYFRIRFATGHVLDMKLASEHRETRDDGTLVQLRLVNRESELTAVAWPRTGVLRAKLRGPDNITFDARRVGAPGRSELRSSAPGTDHATTPPTTTAVAE